MRALSVKTVGPGVAVQDFGRPGYLAHGLTRGGAADPLAVHEGAALLGQSASLAVLEMVGVGGTFEARQDTRIALTGAAMTVHMDGSPIAWNASHMLRAGCTLTLGGTREGTYAYLHVGGGFDTPPLLGARATHLSTGLGRLVAAGDALPVGPDVGAGTGLCLPRDARFAGGTVRVVPSAQTLDFAPSLRERFEKTQFRRDPRGNRQGVRLDSDGPGFSNPEQLSVVSEVIVPGDIQIAGDGAPFVLLAESQTTGGYPRIGTVLPCDLPIVAQATPGASLRFAFVTFEEACTAQARANRDIEALGQRVSPLLRDPAQMPDLLSYTLVDGAISALHTPLDQET